MTRLTFRKDWLSGAPEDIRRFFGPGLSACCSPGSEPLVAYKISSASSPKNTLTLNTAAHVKKIKGQAIRPRAPILVTIPIARYKAIAALNIGNQRAVFPAITDMPRIYEQRVLLVALESHQVQFAFDRDLIPGFQVLDHVRGSLLVTEAGDWAIGSRIDLEIAFTAGHGDGISLHASNESKVLHSKLTHLLSFPL
jgi:hypothetical protein